MNDDMQKQFVSWLASKLGAKDENDLKSKMQQLGQDGIKQAYQSFMQEQQQGVQQSGDDQTASVPTQARGGMLEYIQRLQAFKSGGSMRSGARCDSSVETKPAKYGERSDGGKVEHTAVGKNHGIGKTLVRKGNGTREDNSVQETKPGKKDWMDTGKNKKEHTAVTRVPKGQMGGTATYSQGTPKKTIEVTKADGSTGEWGNAIPQAPSKQYYLHPMQGGVNQITQDQLDHINKSNPQIGRMIGAGVAQPGQVTRYGADQSDMIRKALTQYPMQKNYLPVGQPTMANLAKGGKMGTKERLAMNLMKAEKGKKKKKNYMQDGGDIDPSNVVIAESGMRLDIERGQMIKSGQKGYDAKTDHTSRRKDAAKVDPKSSRTEADKPVIKKDSRKDAARVINHSELVSPTHGKKKPREFQTGGPMTPQMGKPVKAPTPRKGKTMVTPGYGTMSK